ncbi:MAG: GIY-YIG nuclease family protein [Bacteroidales bacterium]|nr:GIY-YIG nuclease family protein [Bacteroidales bacterium]
MYAIIDIETTGGSAKLEKITEIAIYLHDGKKITGEYSTLVNPERNIPYFITSLTGISNEMVENAPRFYEIAAKIIELTKGRIFVAHNVKFDYSFIRQEFKSLGYNFSRRLLDTCSLSRKLFPGYSSYSLGNICHELSIPVTDRHRASGDALATVRLFEMILEKDSDRSAAESSLVRNPRISALNPMLDPAKIDSIPEEAGVYYYYNEKGDLIYIGKSKNLHKRVNTHLSDNSSGRAMKMRDHTADISWETTGSELIALLRESFEIKQNKPFYNRAQRRSSFRWGIYSSTDDKGYIIFNIMPVSDEKDPLTVFTSRESARSRLESLAVSYNLCRKLTGLYEGDGACFQYHVGICRGACCGQESPSAHNARALKAIGQFVFSERSFFIIDRGRNDDEKSAVRIIKGKYTGYGYFNINDMGSGLEAIHDCIKPFPDNRDIQVILKQYLKNNKAEKIIEF